MVLDVIDIDVEFLVGSVPVGKTVHAGLQPEQTFFGVVLGVVNGGQL